MHGARLSISLIVLFFAVGAQAQAISFDYFYQFEAESVTNAPQVGGLEVTFPEAARRNGVEGRAVVSATLGSDGRAHDVKIVQNLPYGVGEAVAEGLRKWVFSPATYEGRPVPVKVTLEYVVTMVFGENDPAISKPVVTTKPITAPYPSKYAADKVKGKVSVRVLFRSDGTKKVISVSSVMPREFDRAAADAVAGLQFQPAVHKKTKKPVSAEMTVEFTFKP